MRKALLRRYSDNIRQLEDIFELQTRLNEMFAQQSREFRIDFENIEQFRSLTRTAFNEIENSSNWKLFFKYPRYWLIAETHSKYFAPTQVQLHEAIREMEHGSAP